MTTLPEVPTSLQRQLDATAPSTSCSLPIAELHGIFWQSTGAVGIADAIEFALDHPDLAVTHENARELLRAWSHPMHPEHDAMCRAEAKALEKFIEDEQADRWANAAVERAMEQRGY